MVSQHLETQQRPSIRRPSWLTTVLARRNLTSAQKQEYIKAVKCLQSTKGRLGKYWPGVRSRFDDYVVTHINLTEYVHFTVSTGTRSIWLLLWLTTHCTGSLSAVSQPRR